MTMIHELKIDEQYLNEILSEEKTFEVRSEKDRRFGEGDILKLRGYNRAMRMYTGGCAYVKVTYVLRDQNYCKKNMAILGIKLLITYDN